MRTKRGSWMKRAVLSEDELFHWDWYDEDTDEDREMLLEVEVDPGDPGSPGEYPPGYAQAMIISGTWAEGGEVPQEILEEIGMGPTFQEAYFEKHGPLTADEIADIKGDIDYHALADEGGRL